MREFLAWVIVIAILVFGGMALKAVLFPVKTANNLVNTAYNVQDKTLNANNAIYNYEWFKQQKEDIVALKNKVDIADKAINDFEFLGGARRDWTFEDKNEDARLRAVKQGNQSQLETAIADYNARSKMANRNIFADGILPSYIDALTFQFKQ